MKVLSIGAHPDDIEVGMGGTVASYCKRGHQVLMVTSTIPNNFSMRYKEAENAAKLLGADFLCMELPPDELIFSRALVRRVDEIVKAYLPDVIYCHWNHDSHQDHVALSNAVVAATRKNTCPVYMYEQTIPGGITPYSFRTQMFVDITDVIDKKIDSILAHSSQVGNNRDWWAYGVKGRAMYRGYQMNVKYAEAFEVIKDIVHM